MVSLYTLVVYFRSHTTYNLTNITKGCIFILEKIALTFNSADFLKLSRLQGSVERRALSPVTWRVTRLIAGYVSRARAVSHAHVIQLEL